MSKILVIFTGGTIGSTVEHGVLKVNDSTKYLLLQKFHEQFDTEVLFDTLSPFEILSENMTHHEWQKLCDTIREVDYKKYQGIIVAHGSDTLSYTSALLAYAFSDIPIPLLLVSSHFPLTDNRENGTSCFWGAVRYILEGGEAGVYAVALDKDANLNIHLGTCLLPCDPVHDAFSDYHEKPLASFEQNGLLVKNEKPFYDMKKVHLGKLSFGHHVLSIHANPDTNYQVFCPLENTRAVIHTLYHSDTACTEKEAYNLLEFIRRCQQKGIDFYFWSPSQKPHQLYETSALLTKSGATFLRGISFPAAYAKLHVAYAQKVYSPKVFMSQLL